MTSADRARRRQRARAARQALALCVAEPNARPWITASRRSGRIASNWAAALRVRIQLAAEQETGP